MVIILIISVILPLIFLVIRSVFVLGTFSLKAVLIPFKMFLMVTLRWGKYLVVPVAALILFFPSEFSATNGKLFEKLGFFILAVSLLYILKGTIGTFGKVVTVALWIGISLIGIKYSNLPMPFGIFGEKPTPKVKYYFVPFESKKVLVHNKNNCQPDCLERITFLEHKLEDDKNFYSNKYSLSGYQEYISKKMDSIYQSTFGSSSEISTLSKEAFFGSSKSNDSLDSIKNRIIKSLGW